MKVILANHYGFCYGVKRAIKLAQSSAQNEGPACTLGPIIHNPQMVARLASEGVGMVESLNEMSDGTIIIRSHGVGPEIYQQAEQTGLHVVDATCPHVKKAQMAANSLYKAGCQVIIIGEKSHPEVKSIVEWSEKQAIIVETVEEAEKLQFFNQLGIVAQTTFSGKMFKKIVSVLLDKSNNIILNRTICTATEQRQAAATEIAQEVEVMIVIGGKNSANTTRLAELCQNTGCKTHHIETAAELNDTWFYGVDKVGITAGASTPDWIIEEVKIKVESMESLLEQSMKRVEVGDIVKGKVVGIHKNEVFVDIGYKGEGIITLPELAYPVPEDIADVVKVDDEIEVYVLSTGGENGLLLSKVKADKVAAWEKVERFFAEKQVIEAKVIDVIKGGMVASVWGMRAFIPASQVALKFVDDLSVYVGETFAFKIIELDKNKQKLVISRRIVLEEERAKNEQAVFDTLEVNQVIDGTVKRIADFGAFVDIGGIDGLVHISDLSWERVKSPSEVVSIGDKVSVMVKSFDAAKKRISLSLKDVSRDPWLDKVEIISIGSYVTGKVIKIADFGAFMQLPNALDGLVRLAELSEKKLAKIEELVKIGDELKVKVISIDKHEKRIGLSFLKAKQDEEKAEYRQYMSKQSESSDTLGDKFGHLFKEFSD